MVRSFEDDDFSEKTAAHVITVDDVIQATKPHALEMLRGPGAPRLVVLDRDTMIIGRSASVDLPLDVADLSRRHMSLTRRESEWICEDLDSRNGLYLNGLRIHSAVLRDGDRIQLGQAVVFLYHQGR
jgi:pSer/pThr/pTyr-binding forkhead associated (FHA) protein